MQQQTRQELQATKTIVRDVLRHWPSARHDDNLLFFLVCESWALSQGRSLRKVPFALVFAGELRESLPKYESVVRLRRMVQRDDPELLPQIATRKNRKKREADFVEYARKKGQVTT